MDDYSSYQGALEIFKKAGCLGSEENCIFGAVVARAKSATFKGAMAGKLAFGPVGFMVGHAIGRDIDSKVNKVYNYAHALINVTEDGVGIMPLKGSVLSIDPRKSKPAYDSFAFFQHQEISKISIEKYMGLREQIKTLVITLADKRKLNFYIKMTEKTLPYQEENMNRFVQKYRIT
ncbi:MAG: hypothetical protein IK142_01435 [Clostridiales bacterium]|nr:hypothetical protein [Clostridiales bacterium]